MEKCMTRAHQPNSNPIQIPQTVPNPLYTPQPAPERAPERVPEKVPAKVDHSPGETRGFFYLIFCACSCIVARRRTNKKERRS